MRLDELIQYSREQKRALVTIAVVALSVALFFLFASRSDAIETAPPKVIAEAPKRTLYVHVAGDVRRPGVYPLLDGARVIDAITAAGGAKKGIDLSNVNLARLIVDGEQVFVGVSSEAKRRSGTKQRPFTGTIYINRASATQFDSLMGIGPVIAKRIVAYRTANGPFVDIADLKKVEGIGEKIFAKIQDRLSL